VPDDQDPELNSHATFLRQLKELGGPRYGETRSKTPKRIIKQKEKSERYKRQFAAGVGSVQNIKINQQKGSLTSEEARALQARVRTCQKCRRPAVRGHAMCRYHGGQAALIKRRLSDPNVRGSRLVRARVITSGLLKTGTLPEELAHNPVAREVIHWSLREAAMPDHLKGRSPRDPERWAFLDRRRRADRCLAELLLAYLALTEQNDPQPWVNAIVRCQQNGFSGDRGF
jgi:hypothetical protein